METHLELHTPTSFSFYYFILTGLANGSIRYPGKSRVRRVLFTDLSDSLSCFHAHRADMLCSRSRHHQKILMNRQLDLHCDLCQEKATRLQDIGTEPIIPWELYRGSSKAHSYQTNSPKFLAMAMTTGELPVSTGIESDPLKYSKLLRNLGFYMPAVHCWVNPICDKTGCAGISRSALNHYISTIESVHEIPVGFVPFTTAMMSPVCQLYGSPAVRKVCKCGFRYSSAFLGPGSPPASLTMSSYCCHEHLLQDRSSHAKVCGRLKRRKPSASIRDIYDTELTDVTYHLFIRDPHPGSALRYEAIPEAIPFRLLNAELPNFATEFSNYVRSLNELVYARIRLNLETCSMCKRSSATNTVFYTSIPIPVEPSGLNGRFQKQAWRFFIQRLATYRDWGAFELTHNETKMINANKSEVRQPTIEDIRLSFNCRRQKTPQLEAIAFSLCGSERCKKAQRLVFLGLYNAWRTSEGWEETNGHMLHVTGQGVIIL